MIEAPGKPAVRLAWVDTARGIGIVLVVYGHAQRSVHFGSMSGITLAVDRLIYAFHMPLFFVISGLFVWPSIRRGRGRFLESRAITIVWPYLLWSVVSGVIALSASRLVNTPLDPVDLLLIPVRPIEQYWFLYALFLCQLAVLAAFPNRVVLAVGAMAGLVVIDWLPPGVLRQALAFLPFVVVGIIGAGSMVRLGRGAWPGQAILLGGGVGVFAVVAPALITDTMPPSVRLVAACAGSAAAVGAAMLLSEGKAGGWLAQLGRASLAIYVLHTLFSAGTRILLRAGGVSLTGPALILITAAGIGGPFLAWRWSDRYGLALVLGLGDSARAPEVVAEHQPTPV